MMQNISDIKEWANLRIEKNRILLESLKTTADQTIEHRGRIAELKELLAALENKPPPVWTDAS